MEHDTTSFWTDIKKYEDIIAADPDAYCFAPLSELYRKLGLVADAITTAERGCERHPEFVSGCLALGRAYLEKGLKAESKNQLLKVVRRTPENQLAQKLLIQLCLESGDFAEAEQALRITLSLNPDDPESRRLLDSLTSSARRERERATDAGEAVSIRDAVNELSFEEDLDDEVLSLDDADIIEDLSEEILDEVASAPAVGIEDELFHDDSAESPREEHKDPLTTGTLAELYVSQGFIDRAIAIYRDMLQVNPEGKEIEDRLRELELSREQPALPEEFAPPVPDISWDETNEGAAQPIPVEGAFISNDGEESRLETLERWLENIRRREKCHSEAS